MHEADKIKLGICSDLISEILLNNIRPILNWKESNQIRLFSIMNEKHLVKYILTF